MIEFYCLGCEGHKTQDGAAGLVLDGENDWSGLCDACRRHIAIGRAADKLIQSAFSEGMERGYRHGFGGNLTAGAWAESKAKASLEALTKGGKHNDPEMS